LLENLALFEARLDELDARQNHRREKAAVLLASMKDGAEKDAEATAEQKRIQSFDEDRARSPEARTLAQTGNVLAGSCQGTLVVDGPTT
jgi:hypothetical protein